MTKEKTKKKTLYEECTILMKRLGETMSKCTSKTHTQKEEEEEEEYYCQRFISLFLLKLPFRVKWEKCVK